MKKEKEISIGQEIQSVFHSDQYIGLILLNSEKSGYELRLYDRFGERILNKEIHEQINDLYPCHGKTAEQEAALCLSLLMGYSVSMYANSEDEAKKKTVLRRSQMILKNQLPSPLKIQLHTIYDKLLS